MRHSCALTAWLVTRGTCLAQSDLTASVPNERMAKP